MGSIWVLACRIGIVYMYWVKVQFYKDLESCWMTVLDKKGRREIGKEAAWGKGRGRDWEGEKQIRTWNEKKRKREEKKGSCTFENIIFYKSASWQLRTSFIIWNFIINSEKFQNWIPIEPLWWQICLHQDLFGFVRECLWFLTENIQGL